MNDQAPPRIKTRGARHDGHSPRALNGPRGLHAAGKLIRRSGFFLGSFGVPGANKTPERFHREWGREGKRSKSKIDYNISPRQGHKNPHHTKILAGGRPGAALPAPRTSSRFPDLTPTLIPSSSLPVPLDDINGSRP